MRNDTFSIEINFKSGNIKSIKNLKDSYGMEWCNEGVEWGGLHYGHSVLERPLPLVSFEESENKALSVFADDGIEVRVERFFGSNGCFVERYRIRNTGYADLFINQDNFGISISLNDQYTYAEDCLTRRCFAHMWCGYGTTFINALRMGESEINLGLVLTKGSIHSYSQNVEKSEGGNDIQSRGEFIFNSAPKELLSGEEYVIEWELFWHNEENFYEQASQSPQFVKIDAEQFTVFEGEKISFKAQLPEKSENVRVQCNGENIRFKRDKDIISVDYFPKKTGEYKFWIELSGNKTYAEFICVKKFEETVKSRIDFIITRQQYMRKGSPLYGAYLIYDNEEEHVVFDDSFADHNACRERIGMALLMTEYLKTHEDERVRKSLDLYISFVKREFYDEKTGQVYNTVGKNSKFVRLYNAPWMMSLFAQMYLLTRDEEYLEGILKAAKIYYSDGGMRFYPNGLLIFDILRAFELSGNTENEKIMRNYFKKHIDNMISNGFDFPKHEVNYEQTIVSPTVSFISEYAKVYKSEELTEKAKMFAEVLRRFNGHQPSFHLNEIPIRFWDDYWFGKSMMCGDTFPHYWSCLTARSFKAYSDISGDEEYASAAQRCIRNCLCLFSDDGRGYSSFIYPHRISGKVGHFYDEWANDQDFALFFAIETGLLK